MRDIHFAHLGAEAFQHGDGLARRLFILGQRAIEKIARRQADFEALDVARKGADIIRNGAVRDRCIPPVRPRHGLKHQRRILGRARQRSGMVHGPAQGIDPGAAGAAIGRFQAGDAAARRRHADRAAGVRSGRTGTQPERHGSPRATARAAAEARRVPRIAARAEHGGIIGRAISEFMGIEFAEQDHPGLFKAGHGGRVLLGDMVLEHARARRAANPGGLIKILVADRNAVQRTTPGAAGDFRFRLFRLGQRLIRAYRHEGIDPVIVRGDSRQIGFSRRHRGERFVAKSL